MSDTGLFIVFDGPEGSGKSTQVKLLKERLEQEGKSVALVRDPGTTRIGEQIRAILLDPAHDEMAMRSEMLLYMAARAQMMSELIFPALTKRQIVISDRFVSSTLAYQLGGDGLSADDIRNVAQIAISNRWPDLTLILDIPAETSMARLKRSKDRIEQRPMSYHQQVHRNYLEQAKADPKRYRVIDAQRSVDEVREEIWRAVQPLVRSE
jgi:dTMP kinase